MPKETNSPDTPSQQDSRVTTGKETTLDRIANEAANRASRREQRYDEEHNIFTK
jgi:hypothetical protein